MAMVVDRRVRVVAEGRDDFARKVAALVDAEEAPARILAEVVFAGRTDVVPVVVTTATEREMSAVAEVGEAVRAGGADSPLADRLYCGSKWSQGLVVVREDVVRPRRYAVLTAA